MSAIFQAHASFSRMNHLYCRNVGRNLESPAEPGLAGATNCTHSGGMLPLERRLLLSAATVAAWIGLGEGLSMRSLHVRVGVVLIGVLVLGCGLKDRAPGRAARSVAKPRSEVKDFDPVGTWHTDNNAFEFTADGNFVRKIIGVNPSGLWWEGEWRRRGNVIHTKITRGMANVGDELIFDINDQDTITARSWGVFKREKSQ